MPQEQAGQLEQEQATGPAFWRSEQSRQRYELATWLQHDSVFVAGRHAQVIASEHRFGSGGTPPAVIELPDGTVVRLAGLGRPDRSLLDDGTSWSPRLQDGADNSRHHRHRPDCRGTKLQLSPTQPRRCVPPAPAPYHRWSPSTPRKGRLQASHVTHRRVGGPKVYDALQHVLDGIRSGVFVARPEKSQFRLSFVPCEYCDPDHLGDPSDAIRKK